jgi:hypothetical protein
LPLAPSPVASLLVLAQHGGHGGGGGGGELAMTIMLVTVLALIWTLVGVVCWIFWRAKKRDDALAAEARAGHLGTGVEEVGET